MKKDSWTGGESDSDARDEGTLLRSRVLVSLAVARWRGWRGKDLLVANPSELESSVMADPRYPSPPSLKQERREACTSCFFSSPMKPLGVHSLHWKAWHQTRPLLSRGKMVAFKKGNEIRESTKTDGKRTRSLGFSLKTYPLFHLLYSCKALVSFLLILFLLFRYKWHSVIRKIRNNKIYISKP